MAAPTDYWVDPSINANSGTGTSGDPFGDLQYALNTVTRNATSGDRFLIASGTTETLSAAISLTTYGTPAAIAPLILEGDGGQATISGGGSVAIFTGGVVNGLVARLIRFTNTGSNTSVHVNTDCVFESCEFDTTTSYGFRLGNSCVVYRCYVHDYDLGARIGGSSDVAYCVFKPNGLTSSNEAIQIVSLNTVVHNSLFVLGGAEIGLTYQANGTTIRGNTFYAPSGTGQGIRPIGSGFRGIIITNNYFSGFNGTGGFAIYDANAGTKPIYAIIGNNYRFNCLNSIAGDIRINLGGDVLLGSEGLVDPASGDFTPMAALDDEGYPGSLLGI